LDTDAATAGWFAIASAGYDRRGGFDRGWIADRARATGIPFLEKKISPAIRPV
jgi:hypothetical protein